MSEQGTTTRFIKILFFSTFNILQFFALIISFGVTSYNLCDYLRMLFKDNKLSNFFYIILNFHY